MLSSNNGKPILAFFCNWAPYRCYMETGRSGYALPHSIRTVRVMCAGRVDTAMILSAFEKGASGVLVVGCKKRECQYGPGPDQILKTGGRVRGLLHILGLESERFLTLAYSSHESEKFLGEINSFAGVISQLGNTPLML